MYCVLRAHNSIKWRPAALPHHARVQPRSLDHSKRTSTPATDQRGTECLLSPALLHRCGICTHCNSLCNQVASAQVQAIVHCASARGRVCVCVSVCVLYINELRPIARQFIAPFRWSFFAWHFSALADSCWTLSISCTGCLAT